MIKAVFFDWFHTLALFDPPRENLHSQVYGEFGLNIPPEKLTRGLLLADKGWFEEDVKSRVEARSREEQVGLALRYQHTVLSEAGVNAPGELLFKIVQRMHQLYQGITFVLFDDVLSTLKTLKERRLILGLITNATKDMVATYRKLGLEPYLEFVVTSQEAGANKPAPPIFLAALEKGGVEAAEAVHVGDQYELDVVGARGVGINPVLIDRYDVAPEVSDCPRIRTLPELAQYL